MRACPEHVCAPFVGNICAAGDTWLWHASDDADASDHAVVCSCCSACVRACVRRPHLHLGPCRVQELYEFVSLVKPQHVVPTVFSDEKSRLAMIKRFAALVDSSAVKRQFVSSMFAKSSKARPSTASSSASPAKVRAQRVDVRQVNVKDEHACIDLDTAAAAQEAAANVICIDSDSDVSESDSHRHPSRRQDSGLRLQGPGASTRTGRTGAPVAASRKVAERKGGSEDADAPAGGAAGGSAVRGTSATTPPSRAKRRSAVLDRDHLVAHPHAVREPLPADCQRKKTLHSYFSAI